MAPFFPAVRAFPLLVAAQGLKPIVIVPGDGSNQLEARLDKPKTVAWYCERKSDWFRLWLDTASLLAGTRCWADNIRLVYDERTQELRNNDGVETRVPDFGGTSAFEELDPSVPFHGTAAFRDMVLGLVGAGYTRNASLRGAPYDFRYAPSSPEGARYIRSLKELVEDTSRSNDGSRVVLVSHSMGCLQVHYFLAQQTQSWKDRFVEKWIPLAGPWGGAAKELRLHASGDNQGVPVPSLEIREEQRSYETNFWLAPVPRWFGGQALVTTAGRNYSAQDYGAFFDDIGFPSGKALYRRVEGLTSGVEAPGVDVVCMYGLGVPTPLRFDYGSKGFDEQPSVFNGDGDGTVNDVSSRLCERWARPGAQARPARAVRFSKVSHQGFLTDGAVLASIHRELGLGAPALGAEGSREGGGSSSSLLVV